MKTKQTAASPVKAGTDVAPVSGQQAEIRLYYHKTDGGAEYLMDKYIRCPNGDKEGIFEGANYIVRLDGAPELTVRACNCHDELLAALKQLLRLAEDNSLDELHGDCCEVARAALARAEGGKV